MLRAAFTLPLIVFLAACNSTKNDASAPENKNPAYEPSVNLAFGGSAQAVDLPRRCYNVAKAEPETLTGTLEYVMFAGPPNFEDVQKGDTPEPAYVLRLDESICISDEGEGFADPEQKFNRVQVSPGKVVWQDLKRFVGKSVTLGLYDQMPANTGHHHEPLLASVSSISAAAPAASQTRAEDDQLADYGTAAMTIRAFYAALRSGEGSAAAAMIVPEKTLSGPFSAASLTKFYGNMRSPIELVSVSAMATNTYLVSYRFTVTRSVCKGRAVVKTTQRSGKNYIARIQALDGC